MVPLIALVLCCALIPVALAAAAALDSRRKDPKTASRKEGIARFLRGRH